MNTQVCYLEHANITVRSLDEAVRFITTAFPHFKIRGQGTTNGRRWSHVGTDTTYLAFSESPMPKSDRSAHNDPGFNHLGFVVEDAEAVASALSQAGFRPGIHVDPHPHRKRVYFHDADDNEWEFVEYLSEQAEERNDYSN